MYMQGKAASHVVGGWGIATLQGLSEEYPEVWEKTRVVLVPPAGGAEGTLITKSVQSYSVFTGVVVPCSAQ